MNLDPAKRPKEILTVFQGPLSERDPKSTAKNAQSSQNGNTVRIIRILHL